MTIDEFRTAVRDGFRAGFRGAIDAAEIDRRAAETQLRFDELCADVAIGRIRDPELIDERLSDCCRTRDQLRLALQRFNGGDAPHKSDPPNRPAFGIHAR
jgi:hypothetical protein